MEKFMKLSLSIPKSLLITRPKGDIALKYLEVWSQKIIEVAKKKGATILDLSDKRANRAELEKIIRKKCPELIVINGHGDYDLLTGQDQEILVKACDNHNILSDSIVYAISCRSAKILGTEVSRQGKGAYIGYVENFIFYYDETKVYRPLEDEKAKLFLEPSNHVAISLLKNHSALESSNISRKYFIKNMQKLLTSDNKSAENSQFISVLYWNFKNQVCLGNSFAKI